MIQIGTEVEEYGTIFNYGTPIPQKKFNSRHRKAVVGKGVNLEPILVLPGINKERFRQENPQMR